ncbi:MAG: DUF1541 domain-containing protein [Defluviitaleaceae bacterium]|nr:DUF1541 domain-containing protein [Defluviitaleaceae bacterium]
MVKNLTKKAMSFAFISTALLFVACGGGGTEPPTSVTPPPSEVEQPTEPTTPTSVVEEGRGMGLRGYIRLNVEHEGTNVISIDPVFHNDTEQVFNMAFANLSPILTGDIDFEAIDIDAFSGATYTARGIINAVADVVRPGQEPPMQPAYPFIDASTQASPPIYSSFGYINEGSTHHPNPTFPVGTPVILAHEHFPGAAGSQAVVTGAFDEIAYAVSFQPGAPGFPFEYAHRWIMHTELWGWENVEVFEPGTVVMLDTDHFPGSRYQIGIVEYYERGTTYQLDGTTRYGLPFWDHQWFTESEIVPAGTDLGDIYAHIADHGPGSHVHGGEGQTYSERTGTDPETYLNSLDQEALRTEFLAMR